MRILQAHQTLAINTAIAALKAGVTTFRFNMCTGSGKTVTAIHLVEQGLPTITAVAGRDVIVVCHTKVLCRQLEAALRAERAHIPTSANWHFYTYHGLAKATLKTFGGKPPLAIIIDEAHQGGLAKEVTGTYTKILEVLRPDFIFGLSATDAGLDPAIFGVKSAANTFVYNYTDAMRDVVINDCGMITVHTGLTSGLSNGCQVVGENVAEVLEEYEDQDVDAGHEDSRTVIEHCRIDGAINMYFKAERGNRAVFFVRTKKLVDYAVAAFLRYHESLGGVAPVAGSLVRGSYSGAEDDENDENITAFRGGAFPVLMNVRKVQEGFDCPLLELAFDCAPSVSNEARSIVQRLGRVVRRSPGKAKSRYYVMVGAVSGARRFDITKVAGERREGYTADELAVLDAHLNIQANTALAMAAGGLNGEPSLDDVFITPATGQPETFEYTVSPVADWIGEHLPRRVSLVRSSLIVTSAEGYAERERVSLSDLVRDPSFTSWTFELARESASRYDSPGKWEKGDRNSYQAALKRGWMPQINEEVFPDRKSKKAHTLESVRESAAQYDSPGKWQKGDLASYQAARNNGWSVQINEELFPDRKIHKAHTLESARESASRYDSSSKWRKGDPKSYDAAHSHGWLPQINEELFPDRRIEKVHTLEEVRGSASRYDSISKWKKGDPNSYNAARRSGWHAQISEELFPDRQKTRTFESVRESASRYDSPGKWAKGDPNSYSAAHSHGWHAQLVTELFPDRKIHKAHTLESVREIASSYESPGKWQKGDKKSYKAAYKRGWLPQINEELFPDRRSMKTHTLESARECARGYDSPGKWVKGDRGSYSAAQRNGWLAQIYEELFPERQITKRRA